jgi:predicted DNA-binding mobile mystery protein A
MSGQQLAARLEVRQQTVETIEKSETAGTVQLKTLRRAAEALDCALVYALVPKNSLDDAVNSRARKIAIRHLDRVAHTMRLEAQAANTADKEAHIEAYIRGFLKERALWDEP